MKTFKQLREDINHQLNERASINPDTVDKLRDGSGSNHAGHDGASHEHDNYARDHKGTAAGKFHAKASVHHNNASNALKKGNMTSALNHSKMATAAAAKAKAAGGSDSGSDTVHDDHKFAAKFHQAARDSFGQKDRRDKKAATQQSMRTKVGRTVGKVKKMFGRK